ncbi:RNA polymerase sigma-70 factor [Flavitalea sp. BT771]|uniref:RNA polymerase sigma factor n=1 Tax=Flavitalea sp. BT771 TaxID=3063329 RepID=UPI0026E1575A|nr:RNA polymerase sigma-70 factor [Flavitalea sp. BT771]MDO6434723.1 RNA polymerase sigma-70 factor [Flavitalea sp. BT771]MDV6223623.1 RNA polymerase sigma-70 factor [Flavitalea sp. BT771]
MFDTQIPDTTTKTFSLPDETDLLALVAEGDEKAFGILFHHYRPKIYAYAFHLFRNIGLADESVQEVFLKVWLHRNKLPHILKFESWLFIIARNQIFDTLKLLAKEAAARKQMAHLLDPEANLVEDQVLTKENEVRLQNALDHLSPQQKLIFTLSRNEGMKHEEIASQLNISRNTVKTHLVHALKTLKDILHFHSDNAIFLLLSIPFLC